MLHIVRLIYAPSAASAHHHEHTFSSPLPSIIFCIACTRLIAKTAQPNTTQATAGIVFQLLVLNLIKHSGGNTYASIHALVAPISSKTAPRSQVVRLRSIAPTTRAVLKPTCHGVGSFFLLSKKKLCMTSRQTKASSGRVVNMFRPKHRRATLTKVLSEGKLFRTLPSVKEPKVRKPARAMSRQATSEMDVL